MGRDCCGRDGVAGAGEIRYKSAGQKEYCWCDRNRCRTAGQHAFGLPQVLHSPCCARFVSRWLDAANSPPARRTRDSAGSREAPAGRSCCSGLTATAHRLGSQWWAAPQAARRFTEGPTERCSTQTQPLPSFHQQNSSASGRKAIAPRKALVDEELTYGIAALLSKAEFPTDSRAEGTRASYQVEGALICHSEARRHA